MRKTSLINICLLIIVAISFLSFKEDHRAFNLISGSWELTSQHVVYVDTITKPPSITRMDTVCIHGKSVIAKFNSDNTFSYKNYSKVPAVTILTGTYNLINSVNLRPTTPC